MTITAWRICKARHADRIWTGDGARTYGGRWSSPGQAAIYVAESRALAQLECLVHFDNARLLTACVMASVAFDAKLVQGLDESTLPENWTEEPPPPETKVIGDAWLLAASSAVLKVPSVVVPGEFNYVLNLQHRDFRKIKLGEPQPIQFDARLST